MKKLLLIILALSFYYSCLAQENNVRRSLYQRYPSYEIINIKSDEFLDPRDLLLYSSNTIVIAQSNILLAYDYLADYKNKSIDKKTCMLAIDSLQSIIVNAVLELDTIIRLGGTTPCYKVQYSRYKGKQKIINEEYYYVDYKYNDERIKFFPAQKDELLVHCHVDEIILQLQELINIVNELLSP